MNVLIVEDELHTASLLQEIVEQDADFLVVQKLESVVETVSYLIKHQNKVDLLFLDIQLADGQSFEIFKHLDVTIPVVFCTAYDDYPLQAFKNNGIDYILKPFKEKEIHDALQKFKRLAANFKTKKTSFNYLSATQPSTFQQHFLAQFREKTLIKKVNEVALFHVENEMVFLYTFEGEKYHLFKKMEYLESVCDPKLFYRINRQTLISRTVISAFEPYFNRKIVLQLHIKFPTELVVSRLKVTDFKAWLAQ